MGIGKILLIGGAAAGVIYLVTRSSSASAAPGSPASNQPLIPPVPPQGASSMSVPPGPKNATGLTLTLTQWNQAADSTGNNAGIWALVQNAANPQQDFVVVFGNTAQKTQGIVQQGSTQNSGLIAQAFVAGLLGGS